jgi:hypothetical protein
MILLTCIFACNNAELDTLKTNNQIELGVYDANFSVSYALDSLIEEFVSLHRLDGTVGEVYIDQYSDEMMFVSILDGKDENLRNLFRLMNKSSKNRYWRPLICIKKQNCQFNIYTGIEGFFYEDINVVFREPERSSKIKWYFEYHNNKFYPVTDKGFPFIRPPENFYE